MSGGKSLVRIGIGEEEGVYSRSAGRIDCATSTPSSFNFAVSEQEREFLDRLTKAIKAHSRGASLLVVTDISSQVVEADLIGGGTLTFAGDFTDIPGRPTDDVDLSDIPEAEEDFFRNAKLRTKSLQETGSSEVMEISLVNRPVER